jgi:large subunit ribosomal protein L23Ae
MIDENRENIHKPKHNIKTKNRHVVTFLRPKTMKNTRKPKYPRNTKPIRCKLDSFAIVRYPLTTESATKKIEKNNTLVFIVDLKANKKQIKEALNKLYGIQANKVNTLVRPLIFRCFDLKIKRTETTY